MPSETRKLAAIMFTDIAAYTALMGKDEQRARQVLERSRELLDRVIPKFNGKLIEHVGDGSLSSFDSAVEAVKCACAIQAALEGDTELSVRIGIHVGDVIFADNHVLGDGVNVASRIHGLAAPGGICISERVYEEIRNQPEIRVKELGEKQLKNVTRPVRVYVLTGTTLPEQPRTDRKSRRIGRVLAAGVAILLTIAALANGVARWRASPPSSALRPATDARAIRSIAVLPLDNFSGDPAQEYFADGMTDELTSVLATVSALRVISRSSVMQYKGDHRRPPPEIAKALDVDAVVEGSVVRIGDKVRITAQLIDAPADKHLWAKSYERDSRDVLALQDELASAIAHEINVKLTPQEQARFASAHPVDPKAHDAYLKGRYSLNEPTEQGVNRAIAQFELAIKADPNFALPYTGLADAYSWGEDWYFPANDVMPKAKTAAEKALQLDDSLAEAHTALGSILWVYDFDWARAESEYRRAIELNPSYAYARDMYGQMLTFSGRLDEAHVEMSRASELDPLSAGIANDAGWPYVYEGNYEAAKEQYRKSLALDPTFYLAQWSLGGADIEAGKFREAILELEKARAMGSPPFVTGWLAYAYAAAGERGKALAMIGELNQMSSQRYVSPFCTALIYVGLGDKEWALDGLERAYEARSQWMVGLKVEKAYDPLRSEPRFIGLLKQVGLDK